MISPTVKELIRRDIQTAPNGTKTDTVALWAARLNVVPQTIYSLLRETSGKSRKADLKNPQYQDWTKIVFGIKKSPPDGAGEISTDQAVALAVKWGKLPEAALAVPDGTYNKIGRDMGLNKKLRRVSRFQAERPNQLHHFDASSSKFLYIDRRIGENEYLVKIHRPGSGDYKNKPIPCERLRPWYYGIVDDHSGRLCGTIFAAKGENSIHSITAVCEAWSEMGLPDALLADQGMLKKGHISNDLIERLSVELPESAPYAKEAHGKIERPWRTAWQRFEKPFYAGDWKKWSMPLSELNRQYQVYLADDYNQMQHRFDRNITRMQAWARINLYGGIVQIPKDAIAHAARRIPRSVGQDGTLELDGCTHEVKGLHSAKVWVFLGVMDDRIVVQDKADGKKYEVRNFKPNNVGEFKAHADTPHQILVKESAELLKGAAPMLYSEKKQVDERIVAMPIKVKEERAIEDHFDVDHFSSIEEAMKEFYTIVGPRLWSRLDPDERRQIEQGIQERKLEKRFVSDFALDISVALEDRRAVAGA